jgi:hypothetical protein
MERERERRGDVLAGIRKWGRIWGAGSKILEEGTINVRSCQISSINGIISSKTKYELF